MVRHHIQNEILYRLSFDESLRFSELKPAELENKLFDYHLKQLIKDQLVHKSDDGEYSLTPDGKRMGVTIFDDQIYKTRMPRSMVFVVIRRSSDNAWLLYKRSTHPLKDLAGFMHLEAKSDKTLNEAAHDQVKRRTGLECDFTPLGGGFFKTFRGDKLESFTNFTLLVCEDAKGDLNPDDDRAEYFWATDPDFAAADMLPNMVTLSELYEAGKPFFVEKMFTI
jgi:ADP-ribose pyrophosphatase YjhB (NUDIX family)/predicted transcriptional regulator